MSCLAGELHPAKSPAKCSQNSMTMMMMIPSTITALMVGLHAFVQRDHRIMCSQHCGPPKPEVQ